MKIKKETWKLIFIVFVGLMIYGSTQPQNTNTTEKTSILNDLVKDNTVVKTLGLTGGIGAASAAGILSNPWVLGGLAIFGLFMFLPVGISSWQNVFHPSAGIPSWVWIAGFVVLLFVLLRRK